MEHETFDQEFNDLVNDEKDFINFVGHSNTEYYFKKMRKQDGTKQFPSWNFAAFFVPGYWFLYRKLYKWFIGYSIVNVIIALIAEFTNSNVTLIGNLILSILVGIFANSIYITHAKRKIKSLRSFFEQFSNVDEQIKANGGTNIVAPLVLLAISLFIALIAVVLFASIASSFLNSSFTNFIF